MGTKPNAVPSRRTAKHGVGDGPVLGQVGPCRVTAPESERWYWRRSLIEPNARGANEIRLVWIEALREVLREAGQLGSW